jgi:hypothetical protein
MRRADHSSKRNPTNCGASLCVIKKPRERGDHSPRWAAEPEMIMIIIIIIIYVIFFVFCIAVLFCALFVCKCVLHYCP